MDSFEVSRPTRPIPDLEGIEPDSTEPAEQPAPTDAEYPMVDIRAAVSALKEFRFGRSLGNTSTREMIEEGRR